MEQSKGTEVKELLGKQLGQYVLEEIVIFQNKDVELYENYFDVSGI